MLWWTLVAIWSIPIAAAEEVKPMVVFLKNGDRLTGLIVSENEKRLVIRSKVAGRVSVQKADIDRVRPLSEVNAAPVAVSPKDAPAAVVSSSPGSGAPPPPPNPGAAKPAAPPTSKVATNSVPDSGLFPNWVAGMWTNWHGNLQVGLNLGIGTTDRTTMYANGTATKKWDRITSAFTYNAAYGEANGIQNANLMAGTGRLEFEISPNRRTYAYGQGAGGYDVIRKIDLEYLGGGGAGYRLIDRPKRVLSGELGFQYQSFNYSTSQDQTSVAVRVGQSFTASVEKLSITQRMGFTPSIEDLSNYQVNFFLTLSYPIFKPLTLNLNLIDQYLSKPATGVQNNDLQIQTTIGITF